MNAESDERQRYLYSVACGPHVVIFALQRVLVLFRVQHFAASLLLHQVLHNIGRQLGCCRLKFTTVVARNELFYGYLLQDLLVQLVSLALPTIFHHKVNTGRGWRKPFDFFFSLNKKVA